VVGTMNYRQLIKDTWEIAKNNKIVWLLGAIQYLNNLDSFIPTSSRSNLTIACFVIVLLIIVFLLMVYGQVGLIQVVYKAMSGEKTSLTDIWVTVKARLGQLIILFVILGLFVACPFICLILVISYFQLPTLYYLVMIIFSIFGIIVLTFADRGVIIGKYKAIESVKRGLLLSIRNLKPVLFVGLSFWFIQRFLVGLAGLIIMSGQGEVPLSILFPFNQLIMAELITKPINDIINYAASLLTYPLQSIMFTILYIKFTAVEPPAEQELGEVIS
jgi:hypothetical protein